jgi:WD40 repeat protein
MWDYKSGKQLCKLSEHDHEISILKYSEDDKLLYSCGNSLDKKMFIWDTSNGYIVASVLLTPDPLYCMCWGGFVKDIKGRDTGLY